MKTKNKRRRRRQEERWTPTGQASCRLTKEPGDGEFQQRLRPRKQILAFHLLLLRLLLLFPPPPFSLSTTKHIHVERETRTTRARCVSAKVWRHPQDAPEVDRVRQRRPPPRTGGPGEKEKRDREKEKRNPSCQQVKPARPPRLAFPPRLFLKQVKIKRKRRACQNKPGANRHTHALTNREGPPPTRRPPSFQTSPFNTTAGPGAGATNHLDRDKSALLFFLPPSYRSFFIKIVTRSYQVELNEEGREQRIESRGILKERKKKETPLLTSESSE